MLEFKDTIFALSSGNLPSGVAVLRLSGSAAFKAAEALMSSLPPQRVATLKTIRSRNDLFLDRALVLTFPKPNSFTGEDCVELHLHGSPATVSAVLSEFVSMEGLRLAEAGEFSRRAFENGKLDLVEIEGLSDLLAAETEMQRRLAVSQGFGDLSRLYQSWMDRLTQARAFIEAELDFADEDDVPGSVSDRVWMDIDALTLEIKQHLVASRGGEIIRDGYKIVIAGPPNAGKSSLLNAMAKRDLAIVTDIAGTTRDILHVDLDIEGFLVRLYDTAGLRETGDIVEREGVRRALEAISKADMILALEEIGSPPLQYNGNQDVRLLRVGTKSDLHINHGQQYDVLISTYTSEGLSDLRQNIINALHEATNHTSSLTVVRQRQQGYLHKALACLVDAQDAVPSIDIRAEYLRLAATEIGRITGHVDVEGLLDIIFSEFCIGK